MTKYTYGVAVAALVTAFAGHAAAQEQIQVVGSSTVFPFSTSVAEQFAKTSGFPAPVVESTGSGGGLKLFCGGVGNDTPDVTNASRRIKKSEFELCQSNGVTDIIESVVGYDGIVIANAKGGPEFKVTREQLFKALAAGQGDPQMWSDVDPALPAIKIEVLGPPPSSGTRDAFEELVMEEGAEVAGAEFEGIREDGAYIDAGENDNLIVSKLEANKNAVGIFGFSFLDQNASKLQGATVGGVEPTFENIASGDYPVSRSLYFYIKKAHVGVIPGLMEFAAEFVSGDASGMDGYLTEKGLIPLPEDAHMDNAAKVMSEVTMTAADF